ncbi:MAG: YihY/virulence factor BrkB family protein [Balneolales bacterium]
MLTINKWYEDNIILHSAGLAFYTIFSLAPLLIIITGFAGFFFGEQASEGRLADAMQEVMDRDMAESIQSFVASARQEESGFLQTMIGLGILLFAATTVIAQLKFSLNTVWDVEPKETQNTFIQFLIDRVMSLVLVLIFGAFLIASFIVDALFAFLAPYLDTILPGGIAFWSFLNTVFFVIVVTGLFTIIFRILPDIYVPWRDVMIGAFVTTILFMIGRFTIELYFRGGGIESTYGAAGSFVIFLIWMYYNIMVVFLGAEFTKVFANRYGSKVRPAHYARFSSRYSREQYLRDRRGEPSGSD